MIEFELFDDGGDVAGNAAGESLAGVDPEVLSILESYGLTAADLQSDAVAGVLEEISQSRANGGGQVAGGGHAAGSASAAEPRFGTGTCNGCGGDGIRGDDRCWWCNGTGVG